MSCPDGFWCLQGKDYINIAILIVTIIAIYYGPIRAVQITRQNDELREKRRRQYEIFHNLMKTRRSILSPEHVSSLNLIQIEFYDQTRIIDAFKSYITLLSREVPALGTSQDQVRRFFQEQDEGFFELVHEIGKPLGFVLDKHDLGKYSYAPQGWGNTETQVGTLRGLMIDLLGGRRSLAVSSVNIADFNNKFPPAPTQNP